MIDSFSSLTNSINNCLNHLPHCLQSVSIHVISKIFQEMTSENPINKIVKGTILVVAGSYLLLKCRIINRNRINNVIVIASATSVAYGLYHIFSGIQEFRQDHSATDKIMSLNPGEVISHADQLPPSDAVNSIPSDKDLFLERCSEDIAKHDWLLKSDQQPIQDVLERFKTCPMAEELWRKINLENRVCLVQLPPSEVATGKTIFKKDAIIINADLSLDDKLYWVSYELHNLDQKQRMLELENKALSGKGSREAFAKQAERIEFDTSLHNYKFIKNCFDNGYWADVKDKSDFLLDQLLTKISFEQWWSFIKNSDHTQFMRWQWDVLIKDSFCKHKPMAKDCLQ